MYWTKVFLCHIFSLSNGTALTEAIGAELGETVRQEISNDKEGKLKVHGANCKGFIRLLLEKDKLNGGPYMMVVQNKSNRNQS